MTAQPHTAVLLLIFNRPDTTRRVFAAVRDARPRRLYVAADGPRPGRLEDEARCAETRAIACSVDWPCDVRTLFRNENLGCRQAVSGAINWFFGQEEEGIILEDDCLPHQSFFEYCSALLERYRTDTRVMHIGGDNFQEGHPRGTASYYFSRYVHVWGWASWRRAWQLYDAHMSTWEAFVAAGGLESLFARKVERRYWKEVMERAKKGTIDTWDYQWGFSVWAQHGLAVTPNRNLVENIGFGTGATHTTATSARLHLPANALGPLEHPAVVVADGHADAFTYAHHYHVPRHRAWRRRWGAYIR